MRAPTRPAQASLTADFDWLDSDGHDGLVDIDGAVAKTANRPKGFTTPSPSKGSKGSRTFSPGRGRSRTPSSLASHPAAFAPTNFQSPLSTITGRLGGNLDLESASHTTSHTAAASFSAVSEQQMYDWGRRQQNKIGKINIDLKDGIIFREPSEKEQNDAKLSRAESRRMLTWKVKNFLRTSGNVALSAFWSKDVDKSGVLPRHEFEDVLETFKLGLTVVQKSELMRQYSEDDMVNYKQFVSDHTKPGFNPLKTKHIKDVVLEEPPKRKPKRERAFAKDKRAPLLVFLAGWLFCPVWCVAWVWINSKYPRTKTFARASVVLSLFFTIGIIVAAVLLYILADVDVPTGGHCPEIEGVLIAFRMAGEKATRAAFLDSEQQFRLKSAFFVVYDTTPLARTLQVESGVLLDRLEDLPPDPADPGQPRLHCLLRLRTTGFLETEELLALVPGWFASGALVKALLDQEIPVRSLALDRVQYFEESPDYTPTPVEFKQTFAARLRPSEIDGEWVITRSRPFLMRQPPLVGNALDYESKAWEYHSYSYMQTCWMVLLFTLPPDPCITNSSLSCSAGGASRQLQVRVFTNHTKQLYDVFVRENEGEVTLGTPQPTFLVDEEAAIRTAVEPNMLDCSGDFVWTCSLMHRFNVAKGPHLYHFWIGIVGLSPEAQFAPFEVHTRLLTGVDNTPAGTS